MERRGVGGVRKVTDAESFVFALIKTCWLFTQFYLQHQETRRMGQCHSCLFTVPSRLPSTCSEAHLHLDTSHIQEIYIKKSGEPTEGSCSLFGETMLWYLI